MSLSKLSMGCMLLLGLGLGACLSNIELEEEIKAAENKTQILNYFSKSGQTPMALDNGLYYALTKSNPNGELATRADSIILHYELANLLTGQVLDSTDRKANAPFIYRYGFLYPVFAPITNVLKDGEQAVLAIPGTSQNFPGLPAYTPMRVTIRSYVVRSQGDALDEYIARKGWKVTEKLDNGLRYIRLVEGTGEKPASGQTMYIKYTGRFTNGIAFDGNMARTDTFKVAVGGTSTVVGFQMGAEKMRKGERAILAFPSSIGYGARTSGAIGPFTPLIFEMNMVELK